MAADESHDELTQSFVALTSGTAVSHYKIIEKIGAGGMGEVYLAEDTKLNRKVALKFLPPHLCQDEDCRTRFKREAQAAAKLNHPNIIHVYEVSEYQGRPFFAMEHVEGWSLQDYSSGKYPSIEQILELGIQICEGLEAAHEKGVTHRDIKPSNILIDSHGRAKIVDFGLASVAGADQLTKTGSTLGTIGYMSPEQVRGQEIDHRSDLFSVGVVLYELITKLNPFKRDSEAATLKAVSDDLPEPLARFKSGLPDGLQAVIDKALEKDVKTRYQHADGMLSDLMRVKQSLESGKPTVPVASPDSRPLRTWWIAGALVVVAAVVLIVTKPWVTETASDQPEKIMLAVLPFENLGDPEDEYFADGITDEITARLAGIHNLGVIASSSAMRYKGTTKPLQQIAEEIGVVYILTGSVRWQESGEETSYVRVTPQLVKAADESQIWAQVYDEQLTEVFTVQSNIASGVVMALGVVLPDAEQRVLERKPTQNMTAYNYYLRGQDFSKQFQTLEDLQQAIGFYKRAYKLDTTFAEAMAEASIEMLTLLWFGYDPSEQRLVEAKGLAERSVKSEPKSAQTHAAMGHYYYYGKRDFRSALEEFEYALQLEPSNSGMMKYIGLIKRRLGQFHEAIDLFEHALVLDPLDPRLRSNIAETGFCIREFGALQEVLEYGIALYPDHSLLYSSLARMYLFRDGNAEAAISRLKSAPVSVQEHIDIVHTLLMCYLFAGQFEEAAATAFSLDGKAETYNDTALYFFYVAISLHQLTESEQSRVYLDSAKGFLETLRTRELAPSAYALPPIGMVYAAMGLKDKAISAALEDTARVTISEDAMLGYFPLLYLALTYVAVGELDSALSVLDRLLATPTPITVPYIQNHAFFAPLRDHPRFKALLEKYEKEHQN